MKNGVTAALDRLHEFQPDLRYAVLFDSTTWIPVQPPAGEEWDYEPYFDLEMARPRMADLRPGESDPELWEWRETGWTRVT